MLKVCTLRVCVCVRARWRVFCMDVIVCGRAFVFIFGCVILCLLLCLSYCFYVCTCVRVFLCAYVCLWICCVWVCASL